MVFFSHSNVDFTKKKINCDLCAFDRSESQRILFDQPARDEFLLTKCIFPSDNWRQKHILEAEFVGEDTRNIVDDVIGDLLELCIQTLNERRSYSQRLLVYERSLFKECEEFQVISPQHFPTTNIDCVYQVIPKGLFYDTFATSEILPENNSVTEEELFDMKENVNEGANSVENETKTCLTDACDSILKGENGQDLSYSVNYKGKQSFVCNIFNALKSQQIFSFSKSYFTTFCHIECKNDNNYVTPHDICIRYFPLSVRNRHNDFFLRKIFYFFHFLKMNTGVSS